MSESKKATALKVAQATFEGLAPLLIEHGITSPEAETVLRAVCVHTAAASSARQGRRPNVSRISVKTGVDRHTVAAILKQSPEVEAGFSSRRDSMSRVIDGWLLDPDYTEKGRPQVLDIGDPRSKGRSVWNLIQRYAPGVWPRLIIDEMIRLDYVDTLPSGQLRWKEVISPKALSRRVRGDGASQRMRDAMRALFYDTAQPEARRWWRTAQSLEIEEHDLPLVRKMLRDRLDSMFAWTIDELSSARWRRDPSRRRAARTRVGLSGFMFEEALPEYSGNDKRRKGGRAKR
jgi:hypothetical protein